jgi:hypothetical protein
MTAAGTVGRLAVSSEYVAFVSVYALLLAAASFVVFTEGGQRLIIDRMERLGSTTGAGPWGFLHTFGHVPPGDDTPVKEQAASAESYIVSAQDQTLVGARISLWVLIAGCVACAFAAVLIVAVLPAFVVSGAWTYETYRRAALFVVYGTAAGGLVMGVGLVDWLLRRTRHINCTEGCAAAHALYLATQKGGVSAELAHALATGAYPRLSRLLSHVST